jgi:hypothetical protein
VHLDHGNGPPETQQQQQQQNVRGINTSHGTSWEHAHVTDATLNALRKGKRLVDASDDDEYFTGIHHGANANRQSRFGDLRLRKHHAAKDQRLPVLDHAAKEQ